MVKEILEKNKPALGFAAVTIVGAMIFAATTGTGVRTAEPAQEAPKAPLETKADEPAAPVTSFADMIGPYEEEDVFSVPDVVDDDTDTGPRPEIPSASPAFASDSSGSDNSTGSGPPPGVDFPERRYPGEKVSLSELRD